MPRTSRLDIPYSLAGVRKRLHERLSAPDAYDRPPREVLRPEFVAGLKRLDLRAKVLLTGLLQGLHKSPRRGFSAEFSDYRNFVAGDDPRWIDWRLYARTDRLFIKRFEAESAMRATLVVDASASMGYRSKDAPFSKLGYCVTLAAALAYMLQHQRDRVGLVCAGGGSHGGQHLPPRSARHHVTRLVQAMSTLEADGDASLPSVLRSLAAREKRRGMIIVFSDGLCPPGELVDTLRQLRYRGHDLIFFQVWDPAEMNPPVQDGVNFRDPESGARYAPLPLETYQARTQEHLKTIRRGCLSLPCDHQFALTTSAFDRALLRFLRKRRQRA